MKIIHRKKVFLRPETTSPPPPCSFKRQNNSTTACTLPSISRRRAAWDRLPGKKAGRRCRIAKALRANSETQRAAHQSPDRAGLSGAAEEHRRGQTAELQADGGSRLLTVVAEPRNRPHPEAFWKQLDSRGLRSH